MKKSVVLIAVAVLAGPVSALTYMGTPCSSLKSGQASLGLEWMTAERDFEFEFLGFTDVLPDVETIMTTGRFGIAIGSQMELFGRFGVAEIEDSDREFAWGAGFKVGEIKPNSFSLGIVTQVTSLQFDSASLAGIPVDDIEVWQIQVGPGIVWNSGPLNLYGGPVVEIIKANADILAFPVEADQDPTIGGFAGVSVEIAPTCVLASEFQIRDEGWAAGLNLQLRFGGTAPTVRQRETSLPRLKSGQEPAGYRGYIDPRTGEIQVAPVEPKARLKVDEKGEPVKDKDGNFVFEPVSETEQGK